MIDQVDDEAAAEAARELIDDIEAELLKAGIQLFERKIFELEWLAHSDFRKSVHIRRLDADRGIEGERFGILVSSRNRSS